MALEQGFIQAIAQATIEVAKETVLAIRETETP